jgi:hypothetical protein
MAVVRSYISLILMRGEGREAGVLGGDDRREAGTENCVVGLNVILWCK